MPSCLFCPSVETWQLSRHSAITTAVLHYIWCGHDRRQSDWLRVLNISDIAPLHCFTPVIVLLFSSIFKYIFCHKMSQSCASVISMQPHSRNEKVDRQYWKIHTHSSLFKLPLIAIQWINLPESKGSFFCKIKNSPPSGLEVSWIRVLI